MSGAAASARRRRSPAAAALNLLPWPKVDFAKFGPVEPRPLSRIKKISGANLARNWVMIPHVTQFDEADITDLEAFRVALNKENEKAGVKVTMLAFLIKASVAALKKFPDFNASLDGDNLVLQAVLPHRLRRRHAERPRRAGAQERRPEGRARRSRRRWASSRRRRARASSARPTCRAAASRSRSLGGIGGTAFTPIINAPEVAILGVSKSAMKPVWDGKEFVPRLMLPLSLSYDHRVIDGAAAARFTAYLAAAARRPAARRCSSEAGRHEPRSKSRFPTSATSRTSRSSRSSSSRATRSKAEDSLVTLESDKATMDVPSPAAGTVQGTARSRSATRSARARVIARARDARRAGAPSRAQLPAAPARGRAGSRTAPLPQRRRAPRRARSPARRATPARPTSSARCSCWAPAPAATARRSAPPTSA